MTKKTVLLFFSFLCCFLYAGDTLRYSLDFGLAKEHLFQVTLQYKSSDNGTADFAMPNWTPGYYQMLRFSENVTSIQVTDAGNKEVEVLKIQDNVWRIPVNKNQVYQIRYQVLAKNRFIARPYIDEEYAFVRPTGIFIFPVQFANLPCTLTFSNNPWKDAGTSLRKMGNNRYIASDITELMDSPILVGNLDRLGSVMVKGKSHYFIGREFSDFDTHDMMQALQKTIDEATTMMRDIPYDAYTFISIGKGPGGIEQTNSTAFTFNGEDYATEQGRQRLLNFLTHEYFHHFNIKRISPIELTPLNYSEPNRTRLLWVSEGLSVYYEMILMNRAGCKSRNQMMEEWKNSIETYENNEGKKFQTLAQSSYQTWEYGPFGIAGKTISYYEKGPLIGMLLDFKIRHNTQNQKSLDDVMRMLYWKYYKEENRGFTEKEMKDICENIAGENLDDIFKYIYTLEPIDYNKYFSLAGLKVSQKSENGKFLYSIKRNKKTTPLQNLIFNDIFRNN